MEQEAILYRRFLDGDKDALTEIIRLHKDGLTLYIHSITKHLGLAEELAEETFVRLVVKRPRFHGKSRFKTWLYAIGHHVTVDYLRKAKRRSALSLDVLEEQSDGQTIEEIIWREEQNRLLHRALSHLHREYSQVLYLTYFEELSREEVAAVMRRSKRQIENLIYRAKSALKTQLEKEGFRFEGL